MTDKNTMNGHGFAAGDIETAISEITQIAARLPASTTVSELPPASAVPFDQKSHDLLLKSIDQVTANWVAELEHVRQNSKVVEPMVMERAAKVSADITALYLLGTAALAEAKRGDEVNAKLADGLDRLAE